MLDILAITAPVFLMIAIGYTSVAWGLFDAAAMRILGTYVVYLALPALLFKALSERPVTEIINPAYMLAYLGGSLVVLAAGFYFARRIQRADTTTAAFSAMAATEGRANATQLSGGIYEALTTTAAGLVVAIPFAALAAWIEFRLRRIHKTINSTLVSVLHIVPEQTLDAVEADYQSPESQRNAETAVDEPDRYSTARGQRFAHATG